jgi:hypothetical protein
MLSIPQWRHRDGRPVDLRPVFNGATHFVRAAYNYGAAVAEYVRSTTDNAVAGAFDIGAGIHGFLYELGSDDHAGAYDDCAACHQYDDDAA